MLDKISAVFDSENPLMQALGTAGDLIILNAVTFLCMLPVVTYGAALTARDDILWHMVRGEEVHIIKPFFKSFKRNLRQGTIMGILFLLLGLFLIFDYDIVRSVPAMHSTVFYVMLILAGGFILAVGIYSFALLSRYENTVPATIKNAMVLTLAFFPRTLAMLFFVVGFWLAYFAFYQYVFPLVLLMGISFPGYLCALLYNPIFVKLEEKEMQEQGNKGEDRHV